MNDATLVTSEILQAAIQKRWFERSGCDSEFLKEREPILAAFVSAAATEIAGKLALSGAPSEVVKGCHTDWLNLIHVAIEAIWQGHDAIWRDPGIREVVLGRARTQHVDRRGRPARGKHSGAPGDSSAGQTA